MATTAGGLWFGLDRGSPMFFLNGAFPSPIATDHFPYWLKQNPSSRFAHGDPVACAADFFNSESRFEDVIGTDSINPDKFVCNAGPGTSPITARPIR